MSMYQECNACGLIDCICGDCTLDDDFDPMEDEGPECCSHCGKPFDEWGDLGCGYCDRRSPEWGMLP